MEIDQTVDEVTEVPVESDADLAIDAIDHLLDQVEEALGRLDKGTYGTCRTCAAAIDDARLAGEPTTQECGTCAGSAIPAAVTASAEAGGTSVVSASGVDAAESSAESSEAREASQDPAP